MMVEVKGEVYLHVGNSGLTVSVTDEDYGPTFNVSMSSFGNLNSSAKVFTTKEGLREIGEMLIKASEANYSANYCYAAYLPSKEAQALVGVESDVLKEVSSDIFNDDEEILPQDANGTKYEVCESCT